MADKLEITRGTSDKFEILVVDTSGNPYTLADGEKLVFGIKDKPDSKNAAVIKTVTNSVGGVYTVKFEPDDTINLKYGKWFYDANIKSGKDYHPIFDKPGVFEILANATKWGDTE